MPDVQQEDRWYDSKRVKSSGLQSIVTIPLVCEETALGAMGIDSPMFSSDTPSTSADNLAVADHWSHRCGRLRNAQTLQSSSRTASGCRELVQQRRPLHDQVGQLREQVRQAHSDGIIVGQSSAYRDVISQIALVRPATAQYCSSEKRAQERGDGA